MPLISPWRTAYGEDSAVHSVLCRVSSEGVHAWGESAPLAAPCYSPEWAGGVFAVAARWLAPRVLAADLSCGQELQEALSIYKGNSFAKACLDTAWWALAAKLTETPLHELLGATRSRVPVGADFGVMDDVQELLPLVRQAVEAGFARVKLKFRPGWDLPVVQAVREAHPELVMHIDCNSGYSLDDLPLFRELEPLGLAMIEQPLAFDDLLDHSKLQAALSTPICLDESIRSPRWARQAIEAGSCRYVNVKPGRVGGLTPAVEIHNLCQQAGIPCWVGGMLESAVGASQCIALAMLDNFVYPADIFPSTRFYDQDLAEPAIALDGQSPPGVDACWPLPEPDLERLNRFTVEKAVLSTHEGLV